MNSPAELWAYVYSKRFRTEDFAFFGTLLIISDGAAKFHLPMARYHLGDDYKLFSPTDVITGS